MDAKLSEYIVIAKQTGNDWYVGGMTNWDARSTEVNLNFLKENVSYQATIFKNAPDSYDHPQKYMVEKRTVNNEKILNLDMAKGGGFVVRLEEEN